MDLLSSRSIDAVKLTGDTSWVGDSTDDDLESGERDLESLESLQPLACLTGVLTRLTGILGYLCGVLGSGVLGRLSGVPDGVSDLLYDESCLGAGIDDGTAGLAEVSGTIPWFIRRCNNVHIDIKLISVAWLMEVGIAGKRLLVPVNTEASAVHLLAWFHGGVPWPPDPSIRTAVVDLGQVRRWERGTHQPRSGGESRRAVT